MQSIDSETLFMRMMASGDRLIGAQREEERFAAICSRHETEENLENWLQARKAVDPLAVDYLAAIREWRFDIEGQAMSDSIARRVVEHRSRCRSTSQPFSF